MGIGRVIGIVTRASASVGDPAPTFTSITASTGEDWDTATTHAIVGAHFQNGCTVVAKTSGGSTIGSCVVTFNSSTSLTVTMPAYTMADTADTEAIDLLITNPDGKFTLATSSFTYRWTIYSASPIKWRRADRGATTGGGGTNVSALANFGSAGSDGDLILTAGSSAPAYTASDATWNNQAAITFSASHVFKDSADIDNGAAFTMGIICDLIAGAGTQIGMDVASAPQLSIGIVADVFKCYFFDGFVADAAFTTVGKAAYYFTIAAAAAPGDWTMVTYRNATAVASATKTTDPSGARRGYTGTNGSESAPFEATWVEDFVLPSAATANIRARIANYKTYRYG